MLDKKIRLSVLTILFVLLSFAAYSTYATYQLPTTAEEYVPLCNYEHTGLLDYKVYLKPNSLYDEPTLEPGKTYFTKIVDHIDGNLSYEFTCDKPAKVSGSYRVIGYVKSQEMWEKPFVMMPETSFDSYGQSTALTANFPVDLAHSVGIVETIEDEIGVHAAKPELTVKCFVHTVAETDAGNIDEVIVPTMIIPLREGAFKITGDTYRHNSGSLEKRELVVQQSVIDRRLYWLIALGILFVSFVAFGLLTKTKKTHLSGIDLAQKKYGERIAEAAYYVPVPELSAISLESLEDLVKVADELSKPIIYQAPSSPERGDTYYVFDGSVAYRYQSATEDGTGIIRASPPTEESNT